MPKEEKSSFSHFFREDAKLVLDVFKEEKESEAEVGSVATEKWSIPQLKGGTPIDGEALKVQWRQLRSFFRNGNNFSGLQEGFTPAILAPFYTKNLAVKDFPVWVAGEKTNYEDGVSLSNLLDQLIGLFMTTDKAPSILAKNVERIIGLTNDFLEGKDPQPIKETLVQVLNNLLDILEVKGEEGQVLKNDVEDLKRMLPTQGFLIPFSPNTTFQLLNAAIAQTSIQARRSLQQQTQQLTTKLKDLLQIEAGKGPGGHDPEKLHDALAFADSMVKFNELSALVPDEGSEMMEDRRKNRIEKVVADLEKYETLFKEQAVLFIDESLKNNRDTEWDQLFTQSEVNILPDQGGIGEINDFFKKKIAPFEKFFKAKRIAELECENRYQADIHDEYFEHFTWQNFSGMDLLQSTYFILLVDDVHLFGTEFAGLSEILTNNIPVKIIAIKNDDFRDPLTHPSKIKSLHSQVELGALMMSYKNIYVAQTSVITPQALFSQYQEGLRAFAPSFIYVLDVNGGTAGRNYLQASATIESRDFPGFTFKGLLGTPWGSRFLIDHNPQPSLAWPSHSLEVIDENGEKSTLEVPFTFADWATLNPLYHRYFLPLDTAAYTENLIPLVEYLSSDTEQNIGRIPFIWMVDKDQILHRVAVSWPVVIATQERLDFWRFLQENSGINNFHVAQALEEARANLTAEHNHEVEQLRKRYQAEMDQIKREEAARAMENLAAILLDLNVQDSQVSKTSLSSVPLEEKKTIDINSAPTPVDEQVAPSPQPEEQVLAIDPYIDTALCTSCNECINKNKAMFRYNADKMAFIADAQAGTFRQLVEAAEVCPVGIIHPGTPLNPHEPDLENLMERAAKFNY